MPAAPKTKASSKMLPAEPQPQPSLPPKIALVLQGGGALGAYHIGAYEALAARGFHPSWVAGISIGAFNAAVIAGNEPAARLSKLEAFWNAISRQDFPAFKSFLPLHILHNEISYGAALTFGQPDFFRPRLFNPYFSMQSQATALSFYDTAPMQATLRDHVSFERINAGTTRLTLGATNIETGDLEFFDNTGPPNGQVITPAHVVASGSLPPGFAATEVNGKFYWDGGCVSNTPLVAIAAGQDEPPILVFVIDLFNAAGKPPKTMNEVSWRAKQIQYASRTDRDIRVIKTAKNHPHTASIAEAAGVPPGAGLPDKPALQQGNLDIVHITYRPRPDQIPASDAEFSRSSIAERRHAGLLDMNRALAQAPWTMPMPGGVRARVHKI